jgi:putative endonuclease
MMDPRNQIGKWGEAAAADYLIELGYRITGMNFKVPGGEIDLIAEIEEPGGTVTVFVEVKTRTSQRYGYPEESITAKKWHCLMSAIDQYLWNEKNTDLDWRVDVIAIQTGSKLEGPEIVHFENVIMPDEEN